MENGGLRVKILVSACLLGRNCKYNGGSNYCKKVVQLAKEREVIPVCPEVLAGMPVPRTPIEIVNGIVTDRDGNVVDAAIRKAVAHVLAMLEEEEIEYAVLKARSPTCGVHQIYDGSFSGKLVDGAGILAQALMEAGYRVIDDEEMA